MGWFADSLFGKPKNMTPAAKRQNADEWKATNETANQTSSTSGVPLPSVNPVSLPEVVFGRVDARFKRDYHECELWVRLENRSKVRAKVTRVECLSVHAEPVWYLRPGESRNMRAYLGPVPRSDNDHRAMILYKDETSGDYYITHHYLRFHCVRHTDGDFYIPERFDFQPPVQLVT